MAMTMTQKIFADRVGREVVPGEIVETEVDLLLANDITGILSIEEYEKNHLGKLRFPGRTVFVLDHFTPNKDIRSAENCRLIREFCGRHGIEKIYDTGEAGIEHALVPEKGLVTAGDIVIGADSHTCTYGALGAFSTGVGSTDFAAAMKTGRAWFRVPAAIKVNLSGRFGRYVSGKDLILNLIGRLGVDGGLYSSLEFSGPGAETLSMDERFTVCNMAIEAGAKNGIFPADGKTLEYLSEAGAKPPRIFTADSGAVYESVVEMDLSKLKPAVACPHLPENIELAENLNDVGVDQVVIGSCTNGRLEDLRKAAAVMKGRKVKKGLRAIIIPATQKVYLDALKEGIIEIFAEAGCVVSPPTCGPCLGGHMGILAKGETAVSTTNRNFKGRMGHAESQIYLASPETAAAAAVAGHIISPEQL